MEQLNETHAVQIIKYGRGIQLSRSLFLSSQEPNSFPRCCIVLQGRSGAGKSLWARQYCEHRNWSYYAKELTKGNDTQWFDGYDGERALILDDFTDGAVSFRQLLIWTDIYKHRVQVKGHMVIASWRYVFITSNQPSHKWYPDYSGSLREPLNRRLDHVLDAPCSEGTFMSDAFDFTIDLAGRSPPLIPPSLPPVDHQPGGAAHGNGEGIDVDELPGQGVLRSPQERGPESTPSYDNVVTDDDAIGFSEFMASSLRDQRSAWDIAQGLYYDSEHFEPQDGFS